jgi:hypothetical protein
VPQQDSAERARQRPNRITDLIESLKQYALQETVGPLKGAGRWIGYGIAGALLIGLGSVYLALGLLRMVQSEWPHAFAGRWMQLLPYLFCLVFSVLVIVLAIARINKQPLNKEDH